MDTGWRIVPLAALAFASAAYAAEYLTVEAAQRAAFPEATAFVPVALALDADQRARLAAVARPPGVRDPRVWRVMAGDRELGMFYADAVIGKQEYIGFALAVDPSGRVLRLDVLEYRETHGWEIRNERWRTQFVGKSAADPVEVTRDIANISGATLSCRHVTDDVRRLLALDAMLARR
ncbi:MAG TPA: FMN-binding protein [Casimicrobiaceae bacterium]|nr:FMN-binding protein [Casimicrobiaceae bacterium]